jgi:hypothetical protein
VDYNFETVWNGHTPELIKEIISFWTMENALPPDEIPLKRAKETAIVTRDGDGRIVGTSTAYARIVPRLAQSMYYYRMYSNAEHRGQRTGYAMLEKTQAVLEEFTKAQATPAALGIILEVENKTYSGRYPQAAWPMNFNFIGYSPRSLPLYAYYFPDAKLLPPAKRRTV